jgi:hypothetical protein
MTEYDRCKVRERLKTLRKTRKAAKVKKAPIKKNENVSVGTGESAPVLVWEFIGFNAHLPASWAISSPDAQAIGAPPAQLYCHLLCR